MNTSFDPVKAASELRSPGFVDCKGRPFPSARPSPGFLTENWRNFGEDWEDLLLSLPLRDYKQFVAGQLHEEVVNWRTLLNVVDDESSQMVGNWIENKVDIFDFFQPFKGTFNAGLYDAQIPPSAKFANHGNCAPHKEEIARHLEEGLRNGSLQLLGKVGMVPPPYLIMPLLMVSGTRKSRLCHDERFLNLFMKHIPFSLEGAPLIPALLEKGDLMASSDEKSAYLGVFLTERSRTFFGIEFGGYYLQYKCLPFGWSESPFVYQSVGMQATVFLRSRGVVTTQYLDDRFLGPSRFVIGSGMQRTGFSIFCNAATLTLLGFTIEFSKSIWLPTCSLRHLGLITHSDTRQFQIPEDKKQKFIELRECILREDVIPVKTLQKFMGKCVSFKLCIPAASLYIRAMALEISHAGKARRDVRVVGDVRDEIIFWRFLDGHSDWANWRGERHVDLQLSTDSSGFAWGAVLPDGQIIHDLWPQNDNRPIHLKETEALLKTLQAIPEMIRDKRVDVAADNQVLVKGWGSQGAKDPLMIKLLKSIFEVVSRHNCDLKIAYVPSKVNPADAASRSLSLADTRLSMVAWSKVESWFGPHSMDLMALDSNAMRGRDGNALPHFTPCPLPDSAGVNVLSKVLSYTENYYCFPPFCMVGSVLAFILLENPRPLRVTLVVPRLSPLPSWWPVLVSSASSLRCLGSRDDPRIVEGPTKRGYVSSPLR
jgi:hypothetical protein